MPAMNSDIIEMEEPIFGGIRYYYSPSEIPDKTFSVTKENAVENVRNWWFNIEKLPELVDMEVYKSLVKKYLTYLGVKWNMKYHLAQKSIVYFKEDKCDWRDFIMHMWDIYRLTGCLYLKPLIYATDLW